MGEEGNVRLAATLTGVGATVMEVEVTVVVDDVIERQAQALETCPAAQVPIHGGRPRLSRCSGMADRLTAGGVGRMVLVLEG